MAKSPAQVFGFVLGGLYVLIGVAGFFVTGFDGLTADTGDTLFGFDVNPFHNVVHLGIGAIWLVAASIDTPDLAASVGIGIGLVYVLAAFLGFTDNLQLLSINDVFAGDNFLHLVSGSLAVIVGLIDLRVSGTRTT